MTKDELIAALERAQGPSRELGDAIDDMALELGWRKERATYHGPPYTSSIDAALTLVPEGWDWCVARISGKWDAQVGEADTFMAEGAGSNASPAIALCIAALKARA